MSHYILKFNKTIVLEAWKARQPSAQHTTSRVIIALMKYKKRNIGMEKNIGNIKSKIGKINETIETIKRYQIHEM